MMARILQLIHEIASKGIHVTKRDLFYTDVKLFQVGGYVSAEVVRCCVRCFVRCCVRYVGYVLCLLRLGFGVASRRRTSLRRDA